MDFAKAEEHLLVEKIEARGERGKGDRSDYDSCICKAKELLEEDHVYKAASTLLVGLKEEELETLDDPALTQALVRGRQLISVVQSLKSHEGSSHGGPGGEYEGPVWSYMMCSLLGSLSEGNIHT